MKVLIIGGSSPIASDLLRKLTQTSDLVISADSGAEQAFSLNLHIDAIVGDFDSISKDTLNFYREKGAVEIVRIPEQDTTDMEKAINYALTKGADDITITAVSGRRNDHFLHSIGLLSKYAQRCAIKIVDDTDIITLRTASFKENCRVGERISLIPFGGIVNKVHSQGLKYPLEGVNLIPGICESVSNETINANFIVTWESGELLVFRNVEALEI